MKYNSCNILTEELFLFIISIGIVEPLKSLLHPSQSSVKVGRRCSNENDISEVVVPYNEDNTKVVVPICGICGRFGCRYRSCCPKGDLQDAT